MKTRMDGDANYQYGTSSCNTDAEEIPGSEKTTNTFLDNLFGGKQCIVMYLPRRSC